MRRFLIVAALVLALTATSAHAAKQTGACSATPSVITTTGATTITASANTLFAFYVTYPNGATGSWPQSSAGTVSYPFPPAADFYPLQAGNYTVTVVGFVGKHGTKDLASCAFTVLP